MFSQAFTIVSGYRYFAAAKKLPGVRELFEKPQEVRKQMIRYGIYKRIDASYYGYRDEEVGVLEGLEKSSEGERRRREVEEWRRLDEARKGATEVVSVGAVKEILFEEEENVVEEEGRRGRKRRRRRGSLLREYASDDLVEQSKEAKAMLNIHR